MEVTIIKVLLSSFLYTIFIVFGSVVLGFFSDIQQLTNWNIIDFIKENKPYSYIILILFFLVVFLVIVVVQLLKKHDEKSPVEDNEFDSYNQRELLNDGVVWEWDGINPHTLVPLCPENKCLNELKWVERNDVYNNPTSENRLNMTIGDSTQLLCTRDNFKKNYGKLSKSEVTANTIKELDRLNRIKASKK